MARAYRILVVGAAGLLGRELGDALLQRRFPALASNLVETAPPAAPSTAPRLFVFGDEPALLEALTPAHLDSADVVFLAGSPASTRLAWPLLQGRPLLAVDMSGTLADAPGAHFAGIEADRDAALAPSGLPALVVTAHPAAQTLALLGGLLARPARLLHLTATVFDPVSERGLTAIQELEQQTVKLLALKPMPMDTFGVQVAFNLHAELGDLARPTLDQVRGRIQADLARLNPVPSEVPAPALQLLQAPLFHACVISLLAQYAQPVPAAAVAQALQSPLIHYFAPGEGSPDVTAAAGEDLIQLGPPRPDIGNGYWLHASLDNLRRTAYSAVDAALAYLRGQP